MKTLEHAIKATGGVSKLADALGIRQNVVSNWRARKRLPTSWEKLLLMKYPEETETPPVAGDNKQAA